MSIVVPDIACLREPNLLIPGKKPIGPVKIDWGHKLTDRLQFYVNLGTSGTDLVTGEVPANSLNRSTAVEWKGSVGRGHDISGVASNLLEYAGPKRLGATSAFTLAILVNGSWTSTTTEALCGNSVNNSDGFRLFAPMSSGISRFRIADSGKNADTSSLSGWASNDIVLIICKFKKGKESGQNITLYNLANGSEIRATKTPTTTCNFSAYNFRIGDSGSLNYCNATFHFTALWDRYLSVAEVEAIKLNPYQFLIPA